MIAWFPGLGLLVLILGARTLPCGTEVFAESVEVSSSAQDTSHCWQDWGYVNFSFEFCCRSYADGVRGHPSCWSAGFSYENCCLPEINKELKSGMALTNTGDYRIASHKLFNLHVNFAPASGDPHLIQRTFYAFEKACKSFRKELDHQPYTLSWFDTIFDGFGLNCPSLAPDQMASTTVYDEFNRCCFPPTNESTEQVCFYIHQLFANALANRARKIEGGEDKYYRDFSELWAFHHFTPSILDSQDVMDDPSESLGNASLIHPDIANALMFDGEPMLGIVWGDIYGDYRSPKFCIFVNYITRALKYIFSDNEENRPLEIFEVGAGYGSLPRIISQSRDRLSVLIKPINIQRYTVLDVRSVIDLQRWYLSKTVGKLTELQDWASPNADATLTQQPMESPLRVELVEREHRDMFVYSYSRASKKADQRGLGQRPLRLAIAINSWHEMPVSEYMWYYNAFIAGPDWQLAADWVLYVANINWSGSTQKSKLLFGPGPGENFKIREKDCGGLTCLYILQRIRPSS